MCDCVRQSGSDDRAFPNVIKYHHEPCTRIPGVNSSSLKAAMLLEPLLGFMFAITAGVRPRPPQRRSKPFHCPNRRRLDEALNIWSETAEALLFRPVGINTMKRGDSLSMSTVAPRVSIFSISAPPDRHPSLLLRFYFARMRWGDILPLPLKKGSPTVAPRVSIFSISAPPDRHPSLLMRFHFVCVR